MMPDGSGEDIVVQALLLLEQPLHFECSPTNFRNIFYSLRDEERINIPKIGPGFRSDLVALKEQNRRTSSANSRILLLQSGRRWPEAGFKIGKFILSSSLSGNIQHNKKFQSRG